MTTLLIDGDTIAFIAASASQHIMETSGGNFQPFARRAEGEAIVDDQIYKLKKELGAEEIMIFLSCPAKDNWRYRIAKDYKSNRKDSVRPLLLQPLKEYLREKYGAKHYAYLEADDAIGVFGTSQTLIKGDRIIVGKDKDFKTIPGKHFQLKDVDANGKPIVREVTPMQAFEQHMAQTLAGDAVDGYEGCPGIGMTRAKRIVANPERLVAKTGTITRGKNKGQATVKWHSAGPCSVWEAIVSQYEKQGLTEADALNTARLAKILLAEDYNIETQEIRLWVPPQND